MDYNEMGEYTERQKQLMRSWELHDKAALLKVAATKEGQDVIMQILALTGIFEVNENTNSNAAAFFEGRRSIGIELMNMLEQAQPNRAGWLLSENMGRVGSILRSMFERVNKNRKEMEG